MMVLSLIHTIGSTDPKGPPQPLDSKIYFPRWSSA